MSGGKGTPEKQRRGSEWTHWRGWSGRAGLGCCRLKESMGCRGRAGLAVKPWGQGPVQAVLWVRKEVMPCGARMEVND